MAVRPLDVLAPIEVPLILRVGVASKAEAGNQRGANLRSNDVPSGAANARPVPRRYIGGHASSYSASSRAILLPPLQTDNVI